MLSSFANDVRDGLSSQPKKLSSKYFYDNRGSELFQKIMALPEYYLTDCEYEIMDSFKGEMLHYFTQDGKPFDLIEFGAGDGLKTKILLRHFTEQAANFRYLPIDISAGALKELEGTLRSEFPKLALEPQHNDYFGALEQLGTSGDRQRIVLFMGSNIGNFKDNEALHFLKQLRSNMGTGDLLLIGFDLKKSPELILAAYNDAAGVTREFNLNLLKRINRELDGNFVIDQFEHRPSYDPETGEARSYLMSKVAQEVHIGAVDQAFSFAAEEPIHTEISRKYDLAQIHYLAMEAGFAPETDFTDHRNYFTDSLWRAM